MWVQLVGLVVVWAVPNHYWDGPNDHGIYQMPAYRSELSDVRKRITKNYSTMEECMSEAHQNLAEDIKNYQEELIQKAADKDNKPLNWGHIYYMSACISPQEWELIKDNRQGVIKEPVLEQGLNW